MSKASEKARIQAVGLAVALRRKIVDCRFPHVRESELLNKSAELIDAIEATEINGKLDKQIEQLEERIADVN